MRKLLIITATLLVAVMVAGPALAAVQNVRVSGSVDSKYVYRKNFDLGEAGDAAQNFFITWTILQVDADLTDQVAATIALINERPWESDPGDDESNLNILLAYVTLREMLYSPLTLVVGRQSFAFGNSFIIDSAGPNNVANAQSGLDGVAEDLTKQTTMDAVRAILDYNPLTIDIIYAQIEESQATSATNNDRDEVLVGVNANYLLGDDFDSVVEAYFWKKNDKSNTSEDGAKADTVYVVGGRVSTNPLEGWNTQVEVAYQKGNRNFTTDDDQNRRRDAWGIQAIANWQIPAYDEYNPTLQYVFTKVTGDAEETLPGTDNYTGWDPMFENQGGGKIYSALFDLTNSVIHEVTFGLNPMEDLLAKLSVTSIHLERELNPGISTLDLIQPDGGTQSKGIKRDNSHLGKEIDFELVYDYTEDVTIHGALGWFFPGSVFDDSEDNTAKQVLLNLDVAF